MIPGMLSSIIGLGSTLGSQIPGLRKGGREQDQLRKMQQGKGAGAQMARRAGEQAARDAAAVAGAGRSGSGGLNLLTGLRAGETARDNAMHQAAAVAARESIVGTEGLRNDDIARRAAIGKVGAAAGGAVAALGATKQAAADKLDLDAILGDGTEQKGLAPAPEATPLDPSEPQFAEPQRDATREYENAVDEPERDATREYENALPAEPYRDATRGYENAVDEPERDATRGYENEAPIDPVEQEARSIEEATGRALGSPSAALMIASGLSPDTILDTVSPGLRQRKLALALMLSKGTK